MPKMWNLQPKIIFKPDWMPAGAKLKYDQKYLNKANLRDLKLRPAYSPETPNLG